MNVLNSELTLQSNVSMFHWNSMRVAKLRGITNTAINILEITRFRIKIFVVLFLNCLFLQMTNTTEKFSITAAAMATTRKISWTMRSNGESKWWSVLSLSSNISMASLLYSTQQAFRCYWALKYELGMFIIHKHVLLNQTKGFCMVQGNVANNLPSTVFSEFPA